MVKVELNHPQEWSRLLHALSEFNAAVQSDELVISVVPYAGAEVNEQAALLNRLRGEICPEIIQEASEIAKFLKDNEQGFIPGLVKFNLRNII